MTIGRRDFLRSTASVGAAWSLIPQHWTFANKSQAHQSASDRTAFFLVSDTQYLALADSPHDLDERSAQVCSRLIDTLNSLPDSPIPETAGGGSVLEVQGVIHAGDCVDSADKQGANYQAMQQTEWDAFVADFGLDGTDGRLRFPTHEVHGNHDGPSGQGLVCEGMIERNRRRKDVSLSADGRHHSWDWGGVHFIHLGITVGQDRDVSQRRRYDTHSSLDFLIGDLQQHVGDSGRPVVITHHIDLLRYSRPCLPQDDANLSLEWHPCDVRAYHQAISQVNVIAILHGHTHVRSIHRWNGDSKPAESGFTILNTDNASHFSGPKQAFFYLEIQDHDLLVREVTTQDAWQSFTWTPEFWTFPQPAPLRS